MTTSYWDAVSLLVRLWVEILPYDKDIVFDGSASLWGCELKYTRRKIMAKRKKSASLWGCELKCRPLGRNWGWQGQPPCEAVSWNRIKKSVKSSYVVSLLVRLWVEITTPFPSNIPGSRQPPCEAVSWNALGNCQIYTDMVSLLVRLWVEILSRTARALMYLVSLLVRLWVEMTQSGS